MVAYDEDLRAPRDKPSAGSDRGLWRYGDLLPVNTAEGISLGEGGSPLHRLERAGRGIGVNHLFGKDETRNPTWSFKDRLACLAVSSAITLSKASMPFSMPISMQLDRRSYCRKRFCS